MRYLSLSRIPGMVVIVMFIVSGCQVTKHGSSDPFRVADAVYYSWFVDETERGTRIEITIDKLYDEIHFESLVFRNRKIPVRTFVSKDFVRLEALLTASGAILEDRSEPAEGDNRLLFLRNGSESDMVISSFRRGETKYIKRD